MSNTPPASPSRDPRQPLVAARLAGMARRAAAWCRKAAQARLPILLLLAAVLVPLVAGTGLWLMSRRDPYVRSPEESLRVARQALDEGKYRVVRKIVQSLNDAQGLSEQDRAWPPYLLGRLAMHDAAALEGADQISGYAQAVYYLRRAEQLGFPAEVRGESTFLLGKSLFYSGHPEQSRPFLERALENDNPNRYEAHWLLALVDAHAKEPNYPRALEHLAQFLSDPRLTADEQVEAILQECEIRFHLADWNGVLKVLEKIPADLRRPEVPLWRGRVLMQQATALAQGTVPPAALPALAAEKYRAAIDAFQLCQRLDPDASHGASSAAFWTALCYRALGDQPATLSQWERIRKLFPNTPETTAAAFEAGELYSQSGNREGALDAYQQFVKSLDGGQAYDNRWLPLETARGRFSDQLQRLLAAGQFAFVLELIKTCKPLLAEDRRWELVAQAEQTWGEHLLADAARAPVPKQEPLEVEARSHLSNSGAAWRELARLHYSRRDFPETIWNAAQAMLAARNYAAAAEGFREYLSMELRNRRQPALLALGEALLSSGGVQEALAIFQQCIDLDPSGVPTFQARLLASEAARQRGDTQRARTLLLENLDSDYLTPSSREWRESLFRLGSLEFDSGNFDLAIVRLEEAVGRYPAVADALEARYLLALAYEKSAQALDAKRGDEPPTERERRTKEDMLEKSLRYYGLVLDAFERSHDDAEPTPWQQSLLRNTYFGRGAVLYQLGRFEPAIQAYLAIINRYQNSAEVLEAYVQIFACYRRLNQPSEARNALQLARAALNRLPAEVSFARTTNYSRSQWEQFLESLATL